MLITYVVLNWNSGNFLKPCLDSILNQTLSSELIVVDNGSTNNSLSLLKEYEEYGLIKLVKLPANIGYAAGMNEGLKISGGDVVIPMNSDVVVSSNMSAAIANAFATNWQLGALAVPVYKWNYTEGQYSESCDPVVNKTLSNELAGVGTSLTRRLTMLAWHPQFGSRKALLGPEGSVPVYRFEAIAKAKDAWGFYFDPEYWAYLEDLDLLLRVRSLGYEVDYCGEVKAWHIGSASTSGSITATSKPVKLRCQIHSNKFRTLERLGAIYVLSCLPFILLEDVISVLYGPHRLALSIGYLKNYIKFMLRDSGLRYGKQDFKFGGSMLTPADMYRRQKGSLPSI